MSDQREISMALEPFTMPANNVAVTGTIKKWPKLNGTFTIVVSGFENPRNNKLTVEYTSPWDNQTKSETVAYTSSGGSSIEVAVPDSVPVSLKLTVDSTEGLQAKWYKDNTLLATRYTAETYVFTPEVEGEEVSAEYKVVLKKGPYLTCGFRKNEGAENAVMRVKYNNDTSIHKIICQDTSQNQIIVNYGSEMSPITFGYEDIPVGYKFDHWVIIVNDVVSQSTEEDFTYTFTGTEITEVYLVLTNPGTAVITTAANPPEGGTLTGGGTHTIGDTITITARANKGFYFNGWSP